MQPGFAEFADPVLDRQRAFRAVLEAVAHPGRVVEVSGPRPAPAPLDPATAALCLTLVDFETPLWLDPSAGTRDVLEYLRFHCGCPIAGTTADARFALIADPRAMPPLAAFARGTDDSPERSATLIVQVGALTTGRGRRLTGPGIAGEVWLDVPALGATFWAELGDNHARFPRGVDVMLTAGPRVVVLPRTTRVEG